MTEEEITLWQKIEDFKLDDPNADFKFSHRLARENGWTLRYAGRVIEEYKKFLFLCCTGNAVTPSDPVDQAWHLHLTFTRSYWIDLCCNTLQKDIHHNPTKGGKQEADKFNTYYTTSQQLYTSKFGSLPPADIWQDNHTRFSDINFQRVNTGKFWLIRKPRLSVHSIISILLIVACTVLIQATDPGTIIFFAVVVIGITVSAIRNKNNNRNNGNGSSCSAGCGWDSSSHHGDGHGDSGCGSGCSGCSGSGCSGCGGGD
jgi:hypothetical protein